MKHNVFYIINVTFLLALLTSAQADFDFAELESLEQSEQGESLELARQAANNWSFSAARNYLDQAKAKAYAPEAVQEVEDALSSARSAKAASDQRRREREEQERIARQQAEEAHRRASASTYSSGGGGSPVDYVMVEFNDVCGISGCTTSNLQLSGGPGSYSQAWSNADHGTISKGYNGIAGTYHWSGTLDNRYTCSGNVTISGMKRNVTINAYSECSSAYSSEF